MLGCIFAGAVHDFLSGMLSLRHDGANLPTLIGKYLGSGAKVVMLVFTVLLLMMVGAVFVYSPALILSGMFPKDSMMAQAILWIVIIFAYYVVATLLPIDKIIGRIYPLFAIALLVMAAGLLVGLFVKMPQLPELWNMGDLTSWMQKQEVNGQDILGVTGYLQKNPIFPCLFITIACGAISGFHATQSPLMARCLKNEKLGRPVFYGSMITEGLVALIWAAVSSYFFFAGGAAEVGGTFADAAPTVVTKVSRSWLGIVGSILALCGVVAAPITSGDTALRSARLIIADFLKFDQKPVPKRLAISVPLFAVAALMLWFNIANEDGFNVIWRYFGWANQTLAVFTLWAVTVFLVRERKGAYYLMTLLPACLMTAVSVTYISIAQIGFNLPMGWHRWIGAVTIVVSLALFYRWKLSNARK